MNFYIKGIPTKRRPRFGNGRTYTDRVTIAEEAAIAKAYRGGFHQGKVEIRVDIYPKLPKSTPKGLHSAPTLKKPDCDNVLKIFMDALQGIAYADDKQVCKAIVIKHDMQRIDFDYCVCSVRTLEREKNENNQ